MNKKVVMCTLLLLVLVFLVGCLDYKSYDIETGENGEIDNLLDEIAQIEEELLLQEEEIEEITEQEEEVVGEVILPELGEVDENIQTLTVNENEMVKLNLKSSDPDQDQVTYTFSSPLNNQGTWKTNYGDAGEYLVTVSASDGKLTTEKMVKIVVNRVNVPPVIETLKNLQVKEGEIVTVSPKVNDPNNDKITITISEPLKEGTFKTDHTSAGEYQITVTASDGELSAEETFQLIIEDVNVLPEISNVKDITIKEGETVTLTPKVVDLDGDQVTVIISEPVGNDGVWETGFTDHGTYSITITANDGKQAVETTISLVVEDINMPPDFEISLG